MDREVEEEEVEVVKVIDIDKMSLEDRLKERERGKERNKDSVLVKELLNREDVEEEDEGEESEHTSIDLRSLEKKWLEDSEGLEPERGSVCVGNGILGMGGEEHEEEERVRRSAEEVVSNLVGGFKKNLEWVPKESFLSRGLRKNRLGDLWVVKGLVLIRDDGLCRLCGERVRGNTWKVQKWDKELRWQEDNCFLVCKNCSLCITGKEFGGHDDVERFQKMREFVLSRRRKGVRGSQPLGDFGLKVLSALRTKLGGKKEVRKSRQTLEDLRRFEGKLRVIERR